MRFFVPFSSLPSFFAFIFLLFGEIWGDVPSTSLPQPACSNPFPRSGYASSPEEQTGLSSTLPFGANHRMALIFI